MIRRTRVASLSVALACLATACGREMLPTGASALPLSNVTGTWSGNFADSNGIGVGTINVTQDGTRVGGTVEIPHTAFGTSGVGTFSGTVIGASLSFTIHVSQGGYAPPFGGCESVSAGDASVSSTQIDGSYAGGSDGAIGCLRGWTGGRFMLTKQ